MADRKDPKMSVEVDLDTPFEAAKRQLIETFERAYLTHNLQRSSMNLSATSRLTGISRKHIRTLVRRYDLPKSMEAEQREAGPAEEPPVLREEPRVIREEPRVIREEPSTRHEITHHVGYLSVAASR